ncbi:MAG: arsenite methyltransferase [Actinomycetota bacterium]|jgi:SAM-dependent methyltransferase|nr:arsenite methyltransferase [Actinomycetota bacterium]
MAELKTDDLTEDEMRDYVRDRYAEAAKGSCGTGCCSGQEVKLENVEGEQVFGSSLYDKSTGDSCCSSAVESSLGCGVPTEVADLSQGETVLDLGSGGGADVLISAKRVGPTGEAIGLDMTDEMLELARKHASESGVENARFVKGYIEEIPLPDNSVDVVISNCVINLSSRKTEVFNEIHRVLKPGARFAVSDVIADPDMSDAERKDLAGWAGCIAGALTEDDFRSALEGSGMTDVSFRESHRVHDHASSMIVRARKPLN